MGVNDPNEVLNRSTADASLILQDMVVHNVGSGLATVFPDLDGKKINDAFLLARPLVEFTWNMVRHRFTCHNLFIYRKKCNAYLL